MYKFEIGAQRRLGWAGLALALSVACLAGAARAAPLADEAVKAVVDRAAAQYLRDNPQAAAIAVGVLNDGRTHVFWYGTLTPGKAVPPGDDTLYPIASITKTFTGTLLAQAAVEGRLDLSDDVRKHLDGDYPNLEFEGRPVRLSDLLDHRSGLPFVLPDRPELSPGFEGDPRPYAERVAEVARTYDRQKFFGDLRKVELTAAPGSRFQYSNAAAQLAGYILERAYGQPFEALVKAKILAPLGMADTTISLTDAQRTRLAPGWDDAGRSTPENPEWLQAAGGLKSTTGDLLKYVRWHLEEADPAVRLSHAPVYTSSQPIWGHQGVFSVGLNWQMASLSGRRVIWQDGIIEGASALCVIEPELGLALVMTANEVGPRTARANQDFANAVLRTLDPQAIPLPQ